jgi:hypothetical protein
MLVCLAAAVVILLVVALPKFRQGEPFLTEEGEEALAEARRRTRALAVQARDRAAEAAQQAAEQAKAARERVATLSTGDDEPRDDAPDEARDDQPQDEAPDDDTELRAPAPAAERVQMPVPPTPEPAHSAKVAEPEAKTADVRDGVRDAATDVRDPTTDVRGGVHGDGVEGAERENDVIDLREPADGLDGHLNGHLTGKRGAHRKLNDITFGEPLPGPRHGR